MKWFSHGFQEIALKSSGFQEIALKSRRECMDLCRIDVLRELESQHNDRTVHVLGRFVATKIGFELGPSRTLARSLRSDRAWLVCGPVAIHELIRG